jgi:hypothetical protein
VFRLAPVLVAGCALAAVASAAVVSAPAATASPATVRLVHAIRSTGVQHRHAATSTNWAGWVTVGDDRSVSASWVQPAVTCAAGETSYSSFWVGLDGAGSGTVEQTGTEADCAGGRAVYSAWREFYPAYPVSYRDAVTPGDAFTASATFDATTAKYTVTLTDSTRHWTETSTAFVSGAQHASAEVIAEAPADGATGAVLPLADFGSVAFTGATVDGAALGSDSTAIAVTMSGSTGTKATTSALTGRTTFRVSWVSSSGAAGSGSSTGSGSGAASGHPAPSAHHPAPTGHHKSSSHKKPSHKKPSHKKPSHKKRSHKKSAHKKPAHKKSPHKKRTPAHRH